MFFIQFITSKQDKYGQKYWLAQDKREVYSKCLHAGKNVLRLRDNCVSVHVVMKSAEPYLKNGRNTTTENYFASINLKTLLKRKKKTHESIWSVE